ncbi:GAF domain-containing protein [Amycolatopsis sp. WQ 127309]|uniref:GAF domain-containing protein n=1 Tax=Amycolatopsis sp. WQ 127309 TaxID=2932773 RepID=UPI001FF3B32A|nr:GAF domain-containing protein [Amycolatopsis sp. WQ 127309]UOZ02813.1 GAF domain-containing protein [Amycolatopsis sp. WQ 127309]
MGVHSSLPPGASLPAHARDLVRMHEAVIGGGRPRVRPRPLVSRSWSRALSLGLAADGINTRDSVPLDEVARRRHASPLRHVVGDLGQVLDTANVLLVVTDAEGVILWREGSPRIRRQADTLGFAEGADWREARVGTNAIGTALAEAAPVELLAGEHFEQNQHPWYCTASPVHDPRTGELLGVIDVSGPALTLHPAIGALVETGRRLVESQLWRHHQERLDRLRRTAEPVLAGPALLVDDDGWVAHAAGIAAGERIAAPAEGQVLAVPGLGACLPERLADGWLVRPAGTERRVWLDLDVAGAPMLRMRSGDTSWCRPVTPRHAEILGCLRAAGPAGLSAEALSRALYGDAEHLVTVRAEVSRLRRWLGAIVDTRPYRLAEGVELTVHDG